MDINQTTHQFQYTVPATPVAVVFELGAKPLSIRVMNRTTGGIALWQRTMPDASAQVMGVAGALATYTTDNGYKTTKGFTPVAGSLAYNDPTTDARVPSVKPGFSLGLLDSINDTAGEILDIEVELSKEG